MTSDLASAGRDEHEHCRGLMRTGLYFHIERETMELLRLKKKIEIGLFQLVLLGCAFQFTEARPLSSDLVLCTNRKP